MNNRTTKLTVNVITYNHEKYIQECLDSILMQKTDFDYIIRVFDDASTDTTQDILKQYKEKYPDKFELFLAEKNLSADKDGTFFNTIRAYKDINIVKKRHSFKNIEMSFFLIKIYDINQ